MIAFRRSAAFVSPARKRCSASSSARRRTGACAAFLRREVDIARRKGEPVRLPHRRRKVEFHRHVQVADHPLNDHALLKVLQTKNGHVRRGDVKKLQHHRADAAEMPRPRRAAERLRDALFIHPRGEIRRVHLRGLRVEDQIDPLALAEFPIGFERPGIAGEILLRPELRRVHKDAGHYRAAFARQLPRPLQKGCMAAVKRAHGGNQYDRMWSLPASPRGIADGAENFQLRSLGG